MATADAWTDAAAAIEDVLAAAYGSTPARASVSFLGVEPVEILRYPAGDAVAYCSLGMARHPMSGTRDLRPDPDGPRAELVVEVDPAGSGATEVWRTLAVFAAAPAVEGVVYAPGTTVDGGRPLSHGSRCTGAVVVDSGLADIPTDVGLVSLLQLLPATADELAWCRVHGADALRARWTEQGTDLADLTRLPAHLG